jgi:uracil-DNA glycosylase family 4
LLIVGLAPAAHGGNRTGRMFTGDRSGQWLYRALRKWNFSNQSTFEESNDGLILKDCLITTVAHCAPPENKPTREEMANCQPFLARTLELTRPKVILALGQIAWRSTFKELIRLEIWQGKVPDFRHAMQTSLNGDRLLVLASYHPSQQNTFTGVLTEPMFDEVFRQARVFMDKTN